MPRINWRPNALNVVKQLPLFNPQLRPIVIWFKPRFFHKNLETPKSSNFMKKLVVVTSALSALLRNFGCFNYFRSSYVLHLINLTELKISINKNKQWSFVSNDRVNEDLYVGVRSSYNKMRLQYSGSEGYENDCIRTMILGILDGSVFFLLYYNLPN